MYFTRQKPDFIATLEYLPTDKGGRKTPARSSYRPIIEFPGYQRMTSGEQIFIGRDIVHPGETIQAQITILSDDYFKGRLFVGQTFRFCETPNRTLGTGVIIEITNKELEQI